MFAPCSLPKHRTEMAPDKNVMGGSGEEQERSAEHRRADTPPSHDLAKSAGVCALTRSASVAMG